jgi:hypothetical protein
MILKCETPRECRAGCKCIFESSAPENIDGCHYGFRPKISETKENLKTNIDFICISSESCDQEPCKAGIKTTLDDMIVFPKYCLNNPYKEVKWIVDTKQWDIFEK